MLVVNFLLCNLVMTYNFVVEMNTNHDHLVFSINKNGSDKTL